MKGEMELYSYISRVFTDRVFDVSRLTVMLNTNYLFPLVSIRSQISAAPFQIKIKISTTLKQVLFSEKLRI